MGEDGTESPPSSLAERLNHLFRTVRPEGSDREYSNAAVAQAVGVSDMYIGQLRRGQRTNPSAQLVINLEKFFGLTTPYLSSDDLDAVHDVDQQLRVFQTIRDSGVLPLARRAAEIRSPEGLAMLAATIEHILRGEPPTEQNKPDATGAGA